jgi:hypothetical protein
MQSAQAVLLSVACSALQYFSKLYHKRHHIWINVMEHQMCALIFSRTLSETFLILRRIHGDIIAKVYTKVIMESTRYSSHILIKLHFLDRFRKDTQILNSIIVLPVEAELVHADRQTDRHDEAYWFFFKNLPTRLKMKHSTEK